MVESARSDNFTIILDLESLVVISNYSYVRVHTNADLICVPCGVVEEAATDLE
jgi:hypothetical protein